MTTGNADRFDEQSNLNGSRFVVPIPNEIELFEVFTKSYDGLSPGAELVQSQCSPVPAWCKLRGALRSTRRLPKSFDDDAPALLLFYRLEVPGVHYHFDNLEHLGVAGLSASRSWCVARHLA